jgi:anti-anti-sigma factor
MTIQHWSDEITLAELADDPQLTDEMSALADVLAEKPANVVLSLAGVSFINSSNIAKLLRLRKQMINAERKLILCGVNNQVWGVFLVTGLDKIFEFTTDVSTALAKMQLAASPEPEGGG